MKSAPIEFHYQSGGFSFRNRTQLKKFLVRLIRKEGSEVDHINYIFCNDNYLLKINREYLHHNTLTDIITFQYSEPAMPILSDVYISLERVKENALQFNTGFNRELHRVIFHGALHLCGYKDKKPADIRKMREKEDYYLSRYF